MNNFLKKKISLLAMAIMVFGVGMMVSVTSAQAAITNGAIDAIAAADKIVNTTGADYSVVFDTNIGVTATQLWVIFPVGYTITGGNLTTAAVSDGTNPGFILVDGVQREIDNVIGDAGNRKITITLKNAYDLGTGSGVSFRFLSGIQNPTTIADVGTFTIDSNAAEEAQQEVSITNPLTAGTVSYLTVTGDASMTAGGNNQLTVTAKDQWNNICSSGTNNYTGDKALTFSGPATIGVNEPTIEGTHIGDEMATVTFANGVTDGSNLTLIAYTAEIAHVDVTDGSIDSDDNVAYDLDVTVNPGTAATLEFTTQPSTSIVSGIAITQQPVVTAKDTYGNVATGFTELVTLTEDGDGELTNATELAVDGVANFATDLDLIYSNAADGETFTLTATDAEGAPDPTHGTSSLISSDVLATKLVFTTQPSGTVESGVALAQQPIVKAEDEDNKVDTDFVSTVTLATNEAGTLGGTKTKLAVLGIADFVGLGVNYINSAIDHETFQIDATADGVTAAASTDVNPNITADEMVLTTSPDDAAATNGDVRNAIVFATQPIVKYQKDGIVDTDVTDTVTASLKTGAGTFAGTAAKAAEAGIADFTANGLKYTLDAAEDDQQAIMLTFTGDDVTIDADPIDSDSLTVDVVATAIAVAAQPDSIIAGVSMHQPVINYVDANSRIDTNISTTDTIAITEGAAGHLNGTQTVAAANGVATFTDLTYTANVDKEAVTFTFTDNALGALDLHLSPQNSAETNAEVTATQLVVTQQPDDATATNGDVRNAIAFATQPIVQYQNIDGIVDTDVTDTVTASLKTGAGTFAGTAAKAAEAGIADFTANGLKYTLDASEGDQQAIMLTFTGDDVTIDADPIDSDSLTVDVVATKIAFTQQPDGSVSGIALTTQPAVTAQDANDRTDTDFVGTITLSENDLGDLSGDLDITAVAGVASSTDVVYSASADTETFQLQADADGLDQITSSDVVSNVLATKFLVVPTSLTPVAGVANTLTVTAANAQNKTDVGYDPAGKSYTFKDSLGANISTHTSPNDTAPTIPNDAAIITAFGADGVAPLGTFTLFEAESLGTITVGDGTLFGTSSGVVVRNAAAANFLVTPSELNPAAGASFNLTLTARDAYNNTANGDNGATPYTGAAFITTSATAPYTLSPSSYPFVAGDAGTKTFTNGVTLNTVEDDVSITARDYADATITGNVTGIDVQTAADITAPVITDIQATSVTTGGATITWTTNEVASSTVEYGTTLPYGSASSSATLVTSHSIVLTGLTSNTQYHFRVKSTNAVSLTTTSVDGTFTTLAVADGTPPAGLAITTSGTTVNSDYYTIAGALTADPNNVNIQILNDSTVVGTAVVTAGQTTWSVVIPLTQNATNTLTAVATDPTGNAATSTAIVIVESATAGQGNGTFAVTSITPGRTYATIGGGFDEGWSWTFNVTTPTDDASTTMKFADWISGANIIEVADNIRFYSAQSSNAYSTSTAIVISADDTYSSVMTINGDLDISTAGRQIQIIVEALVPEDTAGGSYSTSYGIQSN
jgi:hypothetical protein